MTDCMDAPIATAVPHKLRFINGGFDVPTMQVEQCPGPRCGLASALGLPADSMQLPLPALRSIRGEKTRTRMANEILQEYEPPLEDDDGRQWAPDAGSYAVYGIEAAAGATASAPRVLTYSFLTYFTPGTEWPPRTPGPGDTLYRVVLEHPDGIVDGEYQVSYTEALRLDFLGNIQRPNVASEHGPELAPDGPEGPRPE